jgi:hypothetical protein
MSLISKKKTSVESSKRYPPPNPCKLFILKDLADRVGFERTIERTSKTLGFGRYGWHRKSLKYLDGILSGPVLALRPKLAIGTGKTENL